MHVKKSLLTLTIALAFVMVAATGCRSNKTKVSTDGYTNTGDILNPQDIESTWQSGDFPMDGTERFENLTRVTDAGAFTPVYFAYDAYNIAASETAKIDYVAEFLRLNDAVVLIAEGHCDERGTHEYNISLGEYRAQSIRDQLIAKGISPTRIQTSSFGKEQPADPGHHEGAWAKNRRAEFVFYRQ